MMIFSQFSRKSGKNQTNFSKNGAKKLQNHSIEAKLA